MVKCDIVNFREDVRFILDILKKLLFQTYLFYANNI